MGEMSKEGGVKGWVLGGDEEGGRKRRERGEDRGGRREREGDGGGNNCGNQAAERERERR